MNRTRLYLDVDGVLNAQMPMGWGRLGNGYARVDGVEYKIRWAPAMIDALRSLDVELVWCTTWRDNAKVSLAPLIGWGEHGRVLHPWEEDVWPSIDWKFPAIQDDQKASPSRFIWIDDEIESKMRDAFHEALVIKTNDRIGISTAQMQDIRDYLAP